MDKKLILFVTIAAAILVGWQRFVALPPPPPPTTVDGGQASTKDAGKTDAPAADSTAADPKADPKSPVADGAKPTVPDATKLRRPEQLVPIDVPGHYHAVLSTYGGALHDFSLTGPGYRELQNKNEVPIDMVTSKDMPLPFDVTFPSSGFNVPEDADFQLEGDQTGLERTFSFTDNKVKVQKHFVFDPKTYEVRLDVTVENGSDRPTPAQLALTLSGWQDPDAQGGIFHRGAVETEAICSATSVERTKLSSLLKEPLDVKGPIRLMAIDRKWFALGVALHGEQGSTCHVTGKPGGRITAVLTLPMATIAAGAKQTWTMVGYAGPKVLSQLGAVKLADGTDAHFKEIVQHGLWGFTELFEGPMLWVLKRMHDLTGNWGVAIILLTLLLKLITWWPTAQSMKSAQAMAKLKPEMDRLKEKYGDDKARMNQEVMALYSKHKINPLGGCLPMLIQMPIYIALYSMLGNSVELYRANFGLGIHDLTAPAPLLAVATGAMMFLQQRLSPTPPDPSQKTMMTMMPIMFTGMSLFLPAGLSLYILTNTFLSMVQQRISAPKKS